MIVEMGIHSHPKFIALRNAVGPGAVEHLTRLWEFCQTSQRGERLGVITDEYLEAICGWTGDPGRLAQALKHSLAPDKHGFVRVDEKGRYIAHNWNLYNANLIQRWKNGRTTQERAAAKAKADAKAAKESAKATAKATALATDGSAEAAGAIREDRIGEERRGGEGTGNTPQEPGSVCLSPSLPTLAEVIAHGATLNPPVSEARCRAFFAHYDGQKRERPDGTPYWADRNGTVVTHWRSRLIGWHEEKPAEKAPAGPHPRDVNARLITIDRRLREIAESDVPAEVIETAGLRRERAFLVEQQKKTVAPSP